MKMTCPLILIGALITAAAQADSSCCATTPRAAPHSDDSVYHLESIWTDQNGKRTELEELKGRPHIVSMIFTHCTYACPIIAADLKAIDEQLSAEQKDAVDFVLFSFDAKRDTPELLTEFAERNGLDRERWRLKVSDGDSIRELAAAFGIRYREEADGQITHSNVILVLNEEGEIVHRQEGLQIDAEASAQTIVKKLML